MTAIDHIRRFHALSGRLAPGLSARYARQQLMRPRRLPPRDWEAGAAASARRVSFRFGLSGLRWGADDAPVVLMLHGWEGRPTQFARFIAPLLAAGRQVIALDGPAHGASPGEEANPILFAQALMEAAAEIRDLDAVVGHSMGGGAIGYALSLGLSPRRVVLLGAPSSLRGVLDRFADEVGLLPRVRRRFLDLVHRHTGVDPDAMDIGRLATDYDVPALVVHDRDDALVPFADGEAMVRNWLGAELLATQGLGHWRILTDPAVVGRVVAFLTAPVLARAA
ncbi:alpha/beta fold hydrolase [Fontimonas sp. SYSU GA230001]|uniref:alpha/beta fold hydrolase n=1 Tax=Fontimonas sp. SYSU GA230001 TaxID=3142450 RepID=UPI0032B3E4DA